VEDETNDGSPVPRTRRLSRLLAAPFLSLRIY